MLVGQPGELADLVDGVDRAQLGGLADGEHPRRDVVFIVRGLQQGAHRAGAQLAVRGRDINELGPCEAFGRTALVHVYVCAAGADHRLVGSKQALESDDVRSRPAVGVKHLDVRLEQRPEALR